jgi:phosphonopyruvate decarboxylase
MKSKDLYETLRSFGIHFFSGVPDSILKEFCIHLAKLSTAQHITAANEGTAIGLAIGHHLATGSIPVVYMQNSGLGNAINPLVSLAHSDVYQIPLLLIIGWRGKPGLADEIQHQVQGNVTLQILQLLEIPFCTISKTTNQVEIQKFLHSNLSPAIGPVAIVVTENTFESELKAKLDYSDLALDRHSALNALLMTLSKTDIVVASTGKLSRELLAIRQSKNDPQTDFLCVGGMGHSSSIATGIANALKNRRVICLDGDGSMQMHLGAAATLGEVSPANMIHVLFNNGTHESVGGQLVTAPNIDYQLLAEALGYRNRFIARDEVSIVAILEKCESLSGPTFIEICVGASNDSELPRPKNPPVQNKVAFQQFLKDVL